MLFRPDKKRPGLQCLEMLSVSISASSTAPVRIKVGKHCSLGGPMPKFSPPCRDQGSVDQALELGLQAGDPGMHFKPANRQGGFQIQKLCARALRAFSSLKTLWTIRTSFRNEHNTKSCCVSRGDEGRGWKKRWPWKEGKAMRSHTAGQRHAYTTHLRPYRSGFPSTVSLEYGVLMFVVMSAPYICSGRPLLSCLVLLSSCLLCLMVGISSVGYVACMSWASQCLLTLPKNPSL